MTLGKRAFSDCIKSSLSDSALPFSIANVVVRPRRRIDLHVTRATGKLPLEGVVQLSDKASPRTKSTHFEQRQCRCQEAIVPFFLVVHAEQKLAFSQRFEDHRRTRRFIRD
jgi:hypothetical protein